MITPIGGNSDLNTNTLITNQLINDVNSKERTQIFKDDSGTRRVLSGKGNDGFYGVKVSPDGVDVFTAPDDQLIFNSNNNVFKIVSSDSFTVEGTSMGSGTTVTTTVAHNLGYTPAVNIYVNAAAVAALQGGSGLTGLPLTYVAVPNTPMFTIQYRIDNDNLYIDFINHLGGTTNLTGYTWTFKYYLLQETAN
jgi:hypothetical protein